MFNNSDDEQEAVCDAAMEDQKMSHKKVYLKDYRVPDYLVRELHLFFNVKTEDEVLVRAVMQVERNEVAGEGLPKLFLDMSKKADVRKTQFNGKDVQFESGEGGLSLQPDSEKFELSVESVINPRDNKSGSGLYMSGTNMITQCEPDGFRKISPYIDRPDNMGIFKVTIEADKLKYPILLSNGNLIEREELVGERLSVTYHDPFPKPSYLFALVVGNYDVLENEFITMSGRKVRLQIFAEKGEIGRCDHAMASLKKAMKWDEDRFGLECDLDEYKIVVAHDFNSGAMENKGLNIFNSKYVLGDYTTATDDDLEAIEAVIAHEYFHNWTGDRVTCRDWFQLTLKEGLTVFRDQEFTSDVQSRALKRIDDVRVMKAAQFVEDSGPNSHPIKPQVYESINNFYTVTVYEKGAEVIRMIHTLIGEENFRKGLKLYLTRNDGQAVTTEDFLMAMEEVSGKDLTQFRLWYDQKGTPTLKVAESYDSNAGVLSLSIEQQLPHADDKPYFIPFALALLDKEGREIKSELLTLSKTSELYRYEGGNEKPRLSLLRNWTAPVKLEYQYSPDDLRFLMMHDTDGFNRYDASQILATGALLKMVADFQLGNEMRLEPALLDSYEKVFAYADDDPALLAVMLTLPAISQLVQELPIYDYQAAHEAREKFVKLLSFRYEDRFKALYQRFKVGDTVAKRSIKNVALRYLMAQEEQYIDLCFEQFENARNMNDEYFAFALLADAKNTLKRDEAVEKFYNKWRANKLLFNKWLSAQARSQRPDLLKRVQYLGESAEVHEFDKQNANNLYALYAFGFAANPVQFNDRLGAGYDFIAGKIIEIDKFNPQVAARLVSAFQNYAKMDGVRQENMKASLERIGAFADLSPNVHEIVEKILKKSS